MNSLTMDDTLITWDFEKSFKENSNFKVLTINTMIPFSVQGTSEKFIVKFTNYSIIKDLSENELIDTNLATDAKRSLYISSNIGAIGNAFSIVNYLGIFINLCLSSFKSSSSFWLFLSTLQILSLLPLFNCKIPSIVTLFFTEYFGASKSSIPFESLPSWIPNPLHYLNNFLGTPYNEKFANCGYTSLNVVYNFSSQMGTWFITFLTFISFCVLSNITKGKL